MKILDLKTIVLFCPFDNSIFDAEREIKGRNIILIDILTDEGINGSSFITGVGVANGSEIKVINTIIENALKPIILGEDPFVVEKLWQQMYKSTYRFGRRGAAIRAISGVDMALWDIIGKKTNCSIRKLLGGYKEKIKVYASGGIFSDNNQISQLQEEVQSYLEQGFKAIKIMIGNNIKEEMKRVRVVREIIGDDVELILDANEVWDVNQTLRFIDEVQECNILFLEEPIITDDLEGYTKLARQSKIPIAAGENMYTRFEFRNFIERKALSIIQPDVTRVGGISEWVKVAHMASAWQINCIPHAVHEIHAVLAAAVSNAPMIEFFTESHYLQQFLSRLILTKNVLKDGYLSVSDLPGLGIQFDLDLINYYRVN